MSHARLQSERRRTADVRFYAVNGTASKPRLAKWRFLACDRTLVDGEKTIAKFVNEDDRDFFLETRRVKYVQTGE